MGFLEKLLVIAIIIFIIALLNKGGISAGGYKKNFPLKNFFVFVLLGVFIRINFLIVDHKYLFKEAVEPIISIILIYLIMAYTNRNGFLDQLKIHDFVGALLIVGGVSFLVAITLI